MYVGENFSGTYSSQRPLYIPRLISNQSFFLCFRPDRCKPFPKVPLTQLIIDHSEYILSDLQFVNSFEKEQICIHTLLVQVKVRANIQTRAFSQDPLESIC